jgi:hypothetical protein
MRRGRYEASRRDDGTVLTADSADALLDLIRADYASNPVPRRTAGADLTKPLDYPIEALCFECGRPVRCERWFLREWVHIERFSNP